MLIEYPLPESWTLDELQRLFRMPEGNPMYDCYPIGEIEAGRLAPSIGRPLVADGCEFFLEADAEDQ